MAGTALAVPGYTVTDLGTVTGLESSGAEAINESGQIVGWSGSGPDAGDTRGFIWENGQMTDLGALGGGDYSHAFDMNDSAQVVGESSYPVGPNGNGPTKAFRWENGQMTDLGSLLGDPEEDSHAYAINGSGQVVGKSKAQDQHGSFWDRAFIYQNGQMSDLGTLGPSGSPGESVAYAINTSGQVVGEADLEDFAGTHAFLWHNGQMSDLGTLSGSGFSVAYDINDNGQVVGESSGGGFLWQSGAMTELVGIKPTAINDTGQVVGSACIFDGGEGCSNRATMWENGQTTDLNDLIDSTSGWTLREATDINGAGQIVGTGELNGETHAFLLTPDPNAPPADTTKPTLNLPSDITKKATDSTGSQVAYTATAEDDIDGPVAVECAPASGSTFPIGTTTVNCSATDQAGNEATGSFKVDVVYDFGNGSNGGFAPPVDGASLNVVKAVSGVPVKFGLGGDFGLDIFAAGYPTSKQISCSTGLPSDPVEETATVSKSGLSYDATSGLYTYVWKTESTWKGSCRELNLKLVDGSNHPIKLEFK